MKKLWLLAFSNIKKSKWQTLTIIALVLISVILLNLWLILAIDYSRNFDVRSEILNTDDVLYSFSSIDESFIKHSEDVVLSDSRTQSYEITENIAGNMTFKYGEGEMNTYVSFLSESNAGEKQIGGFRFIDRINNPTSKTMYVPYLFHTGGGYNIGDKIALDAGGVKMDYIVGGFFENMLAGSFNGGICALILEDDGYATAKESLGGMLGVYISVKLNDGVDNSIYASQIAEKILEKDSVLYNYTWKDMCRNARTLTANICAAIFAGMSFLIIVIALIVIAFNISNSVEEDMKSLGVLKAIGYKSRQIISSILIQFLFAAIIGAVIGIGVSYAALPLLDNMLLSQTGIVWEYEFCIIAMFACLLIVILTVCAAVLLSASKIRRITPLTALRQGVSTHNFKRNALPLERSVFGLNLSLAFKSMFRGLKQNIAVFIIISILMYVSIFSGVLYQNIALKPDVFLNVIAGERASVGIFVNSENVDEIKAELDNNQDISKYYLYTSSSIYYGEGNIMCYTTDDCKDVNNQEVLYAGRFPKYENEVAVGGLFAKNKGYVIGDTVKFNIGENSADYLITGLIQCSNYLGNDCLMTTEGFNRIGQILVSSYFIDLKDNVDNSAFLESLQNKYPDKIVSTVNIEEVIKGSLGVYSSIAALVAGVFIFIAFSIIALVFYLIVKIMLIGKRRELAIQKAIGFTTKQLVLQSVMSFIPVVICSAIVGIILGIFGVNPVLTLFFGSIGIMKCAFVISPILLAAMFLAFTVFSLVIVCLVSLRIKKVSPCRMLMGE